MIHGLWCLDGKWLKGNKQLFFAFKECRFKTTPFYIFSFIFYDLTAISNENETITANQAPLLTHAHISFDFKNLSNTFSVNIHVLNTGAAVLHKEASMLVGGLGKPRGNMR
ncbi:hypothetical protein C0J52_02034 [Blattella germanica]|nr:hypothetical protein C0J52_02034 [Blattella germanica]